MITIGAKLIKQPLFIIDRERNEQVLEKQHHFPIHAFRLRIVLELIESIDRFAVVPRLKLLRCIESLPQFLADHLIVCIHISKVSHLIGQNKHLMSNVSCGKFTDGMQLSHVPDFALIFCMSVNERRNIGAELPVNVQKRSIRILECIVK